MPLIPGARIGVYEVTAQIGAGGMGEVYRARDARLQRDVALKILPEAFATDAERLARFEREAQVLASLNHSNIAAIYGFEEGHALVMELVEGPTLADRIAQGPLALDEALPIASQIVEALEAAHEHGIVHRDLKPANIKLRPDGTVKVLDFGLAKLGPGADVSGIAGASMSPTLSLAFTGAGMILGTAAYMAPEQARGKAVDKRADIWAFGCVLFEMLTGKRVFDGTDATEMIAAVVRAEPEWSILPASTPPRIRALLARCLEKDPKQRLRDIGDARFDLARAGEPAIESGRDPAAIQRPLWRRLLPFAAVTALAGAIGATAVWTTRREPSQQVARFAVPLPDGQTFFYGGRHLLAISPAGTHVAYTADGQLFLRAIDQLEATPIRGTAGTNTSNGARNAFFSPDGQWVGFWHDGQLKKVAVSGGAPVVLCAAENPFGVSWGDDNTILFGQGNGGILRVSGDGGNPEVVVKVETNEMAHGPQMLPGGRTILFTVAPGSPSSDWDQGTIVAYSLETGTRKVVFTGGTDARYVETGHILYVTQGALLALPFDIESLQVTGGPVPLVEDVAQSDGGVTGAAHFTVSRNGTLVYTSQAQGTFFRRNLVWVDRTGREEPINVPPRAHTYVRLSPDGTRIALDIREELNDIWTWDLARNTLTRLTRSDGLDRGPAWTPDGRSVAFSSVTGKEEAVFIQPADGSRAPERLSTGKNAYFPSGFSPDGKYVLAHHAAMAPFDIVLIDIEAKGEVKPLLAEPYSESNGIISPDGRWLAYQSDESGRSEVYVRPFPNVSESRVSISTDGGTRPLWSRDGRTLYYYLEPGLVMAVPVVLQPAFSAGTPMMVVKGEYMSPQSGRTYDVSPDGRRFLMIKESAQAGESARQQFVVVQNWFEELKRRVPTR